MAVARAEPELGGWQRLHQRVGMARRDDAVLAALAEQDWQPDLRDVEAPRSSKGEVVVDQALGPGHLGLAGITTKRSPRALERRPIGRCEDALVELIRDRVAFAGLTT